MSLAPMMEILKDNLHIVIILSAGYFQVLLIDNCMTRRKAADGED